MRQTCRVKTSGEGPCNPQSRMICDQSSPANATTPQNGSPQNLLTLQLVLCSTLPLRGACQNIFVSWNEPDKNERKRPQRDHETNQGILELRGHLEDRRALWPELRFIVESENQWYENKCDVGEC